MGIRSSWAEVNKRARYFRVWDTTVIKVVFRNVSVLFPSVISSISIGEISIEVSKTLNVFLKLKKYNVGLEEI